MKDPFDLRAGQGADHTSDRVRRLRARLALVERDLDEKTSGFVRTLYWLAVALICAVAAPILLVPLAVAYILWQFIDVMQRRAQRARREQMAFARLSGRDRRRRY